LNRTGLVSASLLVLAGTLTAQTAKKAPTPAAILASPPASASPGARMRPPAPGMPPVPGAQTTPGAMRTPPPRPKSPLHQLQEGWIESNGVMIYVKMIGGSGGGDPLVILHGGPGASHDYFLPHVLPLAKNHRLFFIDERGSGRSSKVQDPAGYTIEQMVEDVEGVRKALHMSKIDLLGHSFGGALAQAYALKYQENLSHLILASTWSSTKKMNQVLARMKDKMDPDARKRVDAAEKKGLFGQGQAVRAQPLPERLHDRGLGRGLLPVPLSEAARSQLRPVANGIMSWDLYRQMWGSDGEFVISGNLKNMEYTDRLADVKVPTPAHRRRPRRVRPRALARHAGEDQGLEAGRSPTGRAHDVRRPAGALRPRGRRSSHPSCHSTPLRNRLCHRPNYHPPPPPPPVLDCTTSPLWRR
jgi:proline iminopeptidase